MPEVFAAPFYPGFQLGYPPVLCSLLVGILFFSYRISARTKSIPLIAITLALWLAHGVFFVLLTPSKRLLFYGLLSVQLVMAAIIGAGLWDAAGMVVYIIGLVVLLGLAFQQLIRFVGSEDIKRRDTQ